MNYKPRIPLEELRSNCLAVVERCQNQRVTLLLEREYLKESALLRDHEPKLRQAHARHRQMDRVVRLLLATVTEKFY
jgi:hypothetical protein